MLTASFSSLKCPCVAGDVRGFMFYSDIAGEQRKALDIETLLESQMGTSVRVLQAKTPFFSSDAFTFNVFLIE